MKTRPPKSRQASTQPLRMTVWPAWSLVNSPQVCVRFSMVVGWGRRGACLGFENGWFLEGFTLPRPVGNRQGLQGSDNRAVPRFGVRGRSNRPVLWYDEPFEPRTRTGGRAV